MSKKIKLTVSTGWANGDHVEYQDLPDNWEDFTAEEKEKFINECAMDYLHECCESCGEVVDEED